MRITGRPVMLTYLVELMLLARRRGWVQESTGDLWCWVFGGESWVVVGHGVKAWARGSLAI